MAKQIRVDDVVKGAADTLRGRLVRAFFFVLRWWPMTFVARVVPPQPTCLMCRKRLGQVPIMWEE